MTVSETPNYPCKVALVTGATGAIGKAIARQLAEQREFEVVLLCRNEDKAKQTMDDIQRQTGNGTVRYELADLSQLQNIEALAARWNGPLHVLVNNAAIVPRSRQETPEGIEMQFATNVLGYFRLITAFRQILTDSSPSTIVNVASYWAGGLDIDDLEFKTRRYDNDSAYRQSKQANRMLTVAFAEQLKPYGITVNTCHPGDVHSNLSHDLGFGGHETPDQAAQTPVWLATTSSAKKLTGKYFEHLTESRCRFSTDQKAVDDLYQACSRYTCV